MFGRAGEVLDEETSPQLEMASLSLDLTVNYTCSAVNLAGAGGGEDFQLEIFGRRSAGE